MFVFRRITNNKDKKSATFYSNFLFLQAHCPKNLAKSSRAIFQFSRLMQYLLWELLSPLYHSGIFNSFKCCDTVALAIGSSSWMSPKKQHSCFARNSSMAILAGCPMLWRNGLFAPAPVYSSYPSCFTAVLMFAKIRTIPFLTNKTDEKYSPLIGFYLISPSTSLWIAFY